MIGISGGRRIFLAAQPIDFRKGMDTIAALVSEALKADPFDMCRPRKCAAARDKSTSFRGVIGPYRHIIFRCCRAAQYPILRLETRWFLARDTRLFQSAAHHLDVRSGVAMRGGDL